MLLIQTNHARNKYIKNVMEKVKSYHGAKYGISAIEFEAPSNEDLLINILNYFDSPRRDHDDQSRFGLFFLIYFAYFISKDMSFTNVWPHIDQYIRDRPALNFLNKNDQHKYIKECIYLACTTFNLKHSFYHEYNAFYRNTFFLQIGLTDQFDHINVWLLNDILTPISIRMMIDSRDQNFSLSFYKTWYELKKVRKNSNLFINQSQFNNPFFRRFNANLISKLNTAIKRPIHHANTVTENLMEYIHEDEEIENLRYFYLSNIIQKNNEDLLFEIESVLDKNGYYELNMIQDQPLSHESIYSLYIDHRYQGDFFYDQQTDLFKLNLVSSHSKISILNPKKRVVQLSIYDNHLEEMIYQEEMILLAENDILIAMDNNAIYNLNKLYRINSPFHLLLSPNYDLFDQGTLVSHYSIVLGDLKFYQELDHHKKFKLVSKNSEQDSYLLEFNAVNKIQMIDDRDDIRSEHILITITRINEDKDLVLQVNRIQNGNIKNLNLTIVKWTINQLDLDLSNYNQNDSTLVIKNIDKHEDILYHVLTNKKHTIKILNLLNKKEALLVKAFINFRNPSRHLLLKNKTTQKIKKVKNDTILSLSHLKNFLIYFTIPSFITYLENLRGSQSIELSNEITDEKLYNDLKIMSAYSLDSFEYSGLGDQIWLFEDGRINKNMNLEIWQTGYINLKLSDHILANQETEQETHNHIYLSIQLSNMIQQQEYIILWIDEDDHVHMSEKLEYEILEDRIWVKGMNRNISKLISIFAKINTDESKVKLNYIGSYVNFESDFFSNDYPYLLLISFFPFFSHKIKIFDREFPKKPRYNQVSYHYNIDPNTKQLKGNCHVPDFDPKAFLNIIDAFEKTKSGTVKIFDENDETFDFDFDFVFSTQFQIALKHLQKNIQAVILPNL